MAHNIFIPKLGMTMEEGTVSEWKAQEGEWVEKDQIVLVIETEKVAHEIESAASGFLIILAEAGTVLPCGETAGVLAETREEYEELKKGQPALGQEKDEAPKPEAPVAPPPRQEGRVKVRATPVARKMAKEHGLDLSAIQGRGPEGRIVKEDILRALESGGTEEPPAAVPVADEGKKVKKVIPLSGMRKVISEHMHSSLSVAAQLTLFGEVEMTEMIRLRKSLLKKEEVIGGRITYTDLFVAMVAQALREVPIVNSSLVEDEIRIWDDINIGIAASVELGPEESGLVVPVLKNADKKRLKDIYNERKNLMERARSRKLTMEDMQDGTFTITNAGVFGLDWQQTPIINQPESAILGFAAIIERPVVRDGQMVIRPMMPVCFTYDHRVMDGAPAATFVRTLKGLIENPYNMLF